MTINRTFDGYIREKSIVNDELKKKFPDIDFEESDPELDHAGDIDYLGYIDKSKPIAFGIQIKPITANSNFGSYSPSERMRTSFNAFKEKYTGDVFIIYSLTKEIHNKDVLDEIRSEIARLRKM